MTKKNLQRIHKKQFSRIYIFGGVGAGKTTFASKLSKLLKIPFYTTDLFIYKKDWKLKYSEKQRDQKVKTLAKKEKWIVEGVHKGSWIYPLIKKSDVLIILDVNILRRYLQVIKRYSERRKSKKPDTLKETLKLLSWVKDYKKEYFKEHKLIIKKFKKKYIILKNLKEMNEFLKNQNITERIISPKSIKMPAIL